MHTFHAEPLQMQIVTNIMQSGTQITLISATTKHFALRMNRRIFPTTACDAIITAGGRKNAAGTNPTN